MNVIIILLIASISVAAIFLGAFLWGVKHHQFDDNYAPPQRILFDDTNIIDIHHPENLN
ncbi:MAG TPA: cbb3-type cytochrome oxidase assembly protein CcoS [Puia sp.]|uniref:cbb3-type cytochrome oxidase assembly protein CcoS n=1 Tax=Puia sp. TaxID=2045100 RepID=UPI002CE37E6C|nr:cbb3-type cytochrome oxidase assembly protein CcoS [Puia sp.]HVU94143.1 cbb3-type cytochrome oxidase assembly protein CcoS [Puia sp.]